MTHALHVERAEGREHAPAPSHTQRPRATGVPARDRASRSRAGAGGVRLQTQGKEGSERDEYPCLPLGLVSHAQHVRVAWIAGASVRQILATRLAL